MPPALGVSSRSDNVGKWRARYEYYGHSDPWEIMVGLKRFGAFSVQASRGRGLVLSHLDVSRSRPEVWRTEVLKEVRLAERHTGVAENRVGGRDVKEEIGEGEAGEILTA